MNEDPKRERLMRILEGLLSKADPQNGATEAECHAAMAKATELMTRHGIAEAEVAAKTGHAPDPVTTYNHDHPNEEKARYRNIYAVLRKMAGIKTIRHYHVVAGERLFRMILVGTAADIQCALMLFTPIDHLMHRMPGLRAKEQGVTNDRAFRNAYYLGAQEGILEANTAATEAVKKEAGAAASEQWGIVLVKKDALIRDYIKQHIPTVPGRASNRSLSGDGRSAGYRDGKALRLRKEIA